MNVERLEHLITILEDVIAAKRPFDLRSWGIFNSDDETDEDKSEACGTSACACGYAALDPKFMSEGLNMVVDVDDKEVVIKDIQHFNSFVVKENQEADIVYNRDGRLFYSFNAAAAFFEIDSTQADYLFYPNSYSIQDHLHEAAYMGNHGWVVKPESVIVRIKIMLETGNCSEQYRQVMRF